MKLKISFGLILFLMSFTVLSDTYPASTGWTYDFNGHNSNSGTGASTGACSDALRFVQSGATYTVPWTNGCQLWSSTGSGLGSFNVTVLQVCPGGGTVSGFNCINAPACVSPQIRQSQSPYVCITPVTCTPPEHDNGFGVCGVSECSSAQVLNPLTGYCQTPITCVNQIYDPVSNTCYAKKLQCPPHSHANTANDKCLAEPPLACSSGQHDNGTYECVADDATHCSSNQTTGYINGVRQCINPPVLDTAQKAAADAAAAAKTAETTSQTAATTAIDFNNALAANPTDTALQQQAQQANNNSQAAAANAASLAAKAAQAAADAAIDIQASIDNSLKNQTAGTGGTVNKQSTSVFDASIPTNSATQAQTAFNTQFQSISTQVQGMFTFSHSGSGTLPVFDIGIIHGVHVVADLNRYANPLSYVGLTVMFLAAYISVRLFLE